MSGDDFAALLRTRTPDGSGVEFRVGQGNMTNFESEGFGDVSWRQNVYSSEHGAQLAASNLDAEGGTWTRTFGGTFAEFQVLEHAPPADAAILKTPSAESPSNFEYRVAMNPAGGLPAGPNLAKFSESPVYHSPSDAFYAGLQKAGDEQWFSMHQIAARTPFGQLEAQARALPPVADSAFPEAYAKFSADNQFVLGKNAAFDSRNEPYSIEDGHTGIESIDAPLERLAQGGAESATASVAEQFADGALRASASGSFEQVGKQIAEGLIER